VHSYNSGAVFAALATLSVAKIVCAPAGDFTVYGAFFVTTAGALGQVRADVATVLGMRRDGSATVLLAAAASGRAFTVLGPFADLTVSGARTGITGTLHESVATGFTVVHGSSDDLAFAALGAVATSLGAFGPRIPLGQVAINRALLGVALLRLSQGTTLLAAVQGRGDDDSILVLLATTTSGRA